MGFSQNANAKIWSVDNKGKYSTANVTIAKKNENSGMSEIEFSHKFVRLVGWAHEKAQKLGLPTESEFNPRKHKGVPIKITSCDVTHKWVNEYQKTLTNFVIFGFELSEDEENSVSATKK